MMKLFGEQPLLLSVLLGLLAAAFLYIWTRSGQRALAITGALLLALIPVVWIIAERIVTEEEQIRATIVGFAEHVEANRFEEAYEAVHPDREDIRRRVESELPRYEFSRARVGSFRRIRTLPGTNPPEAVVDLVAGVTVSMRNGTLQNQRAARRVILHLQKTGEGWRVIDYAQGPPVGGFDPYSSGSPDLERLLDE